MPVYSVSSMFFHEYETGKIFDYVSGSGCTSMEFWLETPDFWLKGLPVEEIKRLSSTHKDLIPLTVHSPVLDLNPCSVNPDVAEVSIKSAEKSIEIAEDIGAQVITIHPGRRTAKRPPGKRDSERLSRYIERVKHAQKGKNVKVAIENMQPKVNALLYSPESVEKILDENEWLYFTFDIAHALHISESAALKFVDLFFEKIQNVHVSGTKGEKTHIPPGQCEKAKNVLGYLSDCGYSRHLTLEIDDLNFESHLSATEKIKLIKDETELLKKIFEN